MQKFTPEQWEAGSYYVITREGKAVHRLIKTEKGYRGIVEGFYYDWASNGCLMDYSKHEFDLFLTTRPQNYFKQAIQIIKSIFK
ncbi:hypothetical protein MD537_14765 [Flavihumibacter sediminis]|nr:hypothetical protein [Flavihumibacter sediminis]